MSERDRRLAEKYAAQGKTSASEKARTKEATRASRGSKVPPGSGGSDIDAMRRVLDQPRTDESRMRARRHQGSLPPLG